jgi:Lon protease-like protein
MISEQITLPDAIPVMPLPGALLFPRALLPLYIFEMRYRAMLEHALAHHRMFCVTLIKAHHGDWETTDDFCHIATAGLVRACVGRGDGTSNLILQGLHRVQFTAFRQEGPFPIAEIVPVTTEPGATFDEIDSLGEEVLALYSRFKKRGRHFPETVDRYLSDMRDPEMLADLMAATFITDASRRQQLLEELSLAERLRLVTRYLQEEIGGSND